MNKPITTEHMNFSNLETSGSDTSRVKTFIAISKNNISDGPYIIPTIIDVENLNKVRNYNATIFNHIETAINNAICDPGLAYRDKIVVLYESDDYSNYNPKVYSITDKIHKDKALSFIGYPLLYDNLLLGRRELLTGDIGYFVHHKYIYDGTKKDWSLLVDINLDQVKTLVKNTELEEIKNYKGGLNSENVRKVSNAIKTISTMWVHPSAGFYDETGSYQYIDIIDSKKKCLESLEIIKRFIEEFAPDSNNDE